MKFFIRFFVEGYETTVSTLKPNELNAISQCISEYMKEHHHSFTLELTRYWDPIALYASSAFKNEFNEKRIPLNPFGFHKPLDVQFEYIDDDDWMHYCNDIWCKGECGILACGACIDVCRCRDGY